MIVTCAERAGSLGVVANWWQAGGGENCEADVHRCKTPTPASTLRSPSLHVASQESTRAQKRARNTEPELVRDDLRQPSTQSPAGRSFGSLSVSTISSRNKSPMPQPEHWHGNVPVEQLVRSSPQPGPENLGPWLQGKRNTVRTRTSESRASSDRDRQQAALTSSSTPPAPCTRARSSRRWTPTPTARAGSGSGATSSRPA